MSKLSKSILSKKRKIPKLSAYQQLEEEEEEELDKRRRPDSDQDFSFFEEEQTHAQPPEQYLQQQYQPEIVQGFPQSRSTLPTFQQQQQQQQQEQEQQQSQPFTFGKSLSQESLEEEEPEVVWAIDRKPLKILEHGKSEEWTKVVDSRWPIWAIIQTDSKPRHTTDSHQRIIQYEGIHIRPPVPVVKLYNFISNINNIYVSDTAQCATTAFKQTKHTEAADSKAFDTCCGFTAPITTGILFLLDKICKITDFIQPGNPCKFVEHLTNGVTISHKHENMTVNLSNINEKLFRFYMFISGYAHIKDLGWNERCPSINFLIEGINLVSITGPPTETTNLDGSIKKTCNTYHHFTVLVITIDSTNYAIITDTWAGGEHGCRDPWVRIMHAEHLQALFEEINNFSNEIEHTHEYQEIVGKYFNEETIFKKLLRNPNNEQYLTQLTTLFKIYFNAPDIKGTYKVKSPMRVGILNGPELEDMIWKYMNPESNLAKRPTIEAHKKHNMIRDIPTEPSSPAGSPRIPPKFTETQLAQLIHALGELSQDQGQGFGINKKQNKKTKRKPRRKSRRKIKSRRKRSRKKKNIDEIYEEIL